MGSDGWRERDVVFTEDPNQEGLFVRLWMPEGKPKAMVLLLHGGTEHLGRYKRVARYLKKRGFAVVALDLYGHGKSPGERFTIPDMEMHVRDALNFVGWAREHVGQELPLFLLGISMGGMIWSLAASQVNTPVAGLVLCGPMIKLGPKFRNWRLTISKIVARKRPAAPVAWMPARCLSSDKREVKRYKRDPLVCHNWIPAITGASIAKAIEEFTEDTAKTIEVPLLVMHGEKDKITSPARSQWLVESAGSKEKKFKLFANCRHLLFHEQPEKRQRVLEYMTQWLDTHTEAGSQPAKRKVAQPPAPVGGSAME